MKVGVLGGGQLGQMLMLAGYPLGIEVTCFDHSTDVPAGITGKVTAGALTDIDKLHEWAKAHDILTYEFENFPAELVADLSEIRPMYPGPKALAAAQDRWAEKRLLNDTEIPIAPFRTATTPQEVTRATDELGWPVVAKTRTGGYDGKGQAVLRHEGDIKLTRPLLEENQLIIESWVPFDSEFSVLGARSRTGEVVVYSAVANEHRQGILHSSTVPSGLSKSVTDEATSYVERILKKLDYVGLLAVEFFHAGGKIYANEMAPRVHNSRHWTIEGAETSQFENHLRAIAGLPLGSTALRGPTAMINLVGDEPPLKKLLAIEGANVHLYGKSARPGRKLGHVTVVASDDKTLATRVAQLDELINNKLS